MADAGNSNHISDVVAGPSPIRLDAYRLIVGRALGMSRWFVMDQERISCASGLLGRTVSESGRLRRRETLSRMVKTMAQAGSENQ